MKAAHGFFVVGDLRELDAIEARRRIEQRQGSAVAELLALDGTELRGIELENLRISLRGGAPIADHIGDLVDPFDRADRIAFMIGAQHRVQTEGRRGVEIKLARIADEADAVRIEMMRGGIEILDRETCAIKSASEF